jgi:hypothetical protein
MPPPTWGRPRQALKVYPIGMTKLYELIKSGRVRTKKVDRIRLVDLNSLNELCGLEQSGPDPTK